MYALNTQQVHENFHFNQTDRCVQLDMAMPKLYTLKSMVGTGNKNAYHSTTKVRVCDTKLSVDDSGLGIVKILMHFPRVLYHFLC